MSFPEGFYDPSFILVGLKEEPKSSSINLWQWLEPFDHAVWVCIAVTIILSGIIYQTLDHIPPKHRSRYNRPSSNPTVNCYMSNSPNNNQNKTDTCIGDATTMGENVFLSGLLFTQHFQFMPRTPASRLFSASMAFWALLISSNCAANLASFFVVDNAATLSMQSIEDAVRGGLSICVNQGSSMHSFLMENCPQAELAFAETSENSDLFQAIGAGICAVAVTYKSRFDEILGQSYANPDCNLQWVGRVIEFRQGGFLCKVDSGIRCASLINDVLNLHLTEMKEEGFIEQAWEAEVNKMHDMDCKEKTTPSEDSSASQTMQEMAGTFVIHMVFTLLAVVVMVSGRLYNTWKDMSQTSRRELMRSVRKSIRPGSFDSNRNVNRPRGLSPFQINAMELDQTNETLKMSNSNVDSRLEERMDKTEQLLLQMREEQRKKRFRSRRQPTKLEPVHIHFREKRNQVGLGDGEVWDALEHCSDEGSECMSEQMKVAVANLDAARNVRCV